MSLGFRIFALMALTSLVVAAPAAANGRCTGRPLLAMTYNIRLDTNADGANAWPHRKALLISQIAMLRPELLGMQEVLLNQKRDLEAAFPAYRLVGAGRDDGEQGGEFSPLAIDTAQFLILASGTFWLSPSPDVPSLGWDASYKRVVSWARVARKRDGVRILVLNTHWDHQGLISRSESGKQILRWIRANRQNGERLILLGDFNADGDEESVAQLTADETPKARLFDARRIAITGSTGPGLSFNAWYAFPTSGKLIDHIFVSDGITVRSHAVIAQHENGRVPSDHFPVTALLDIPGPPNSGCR